MQFEHILAPRRLMQTVYVLGHDRREYALFFKLGELSVRGVRLCRDGIGEYFIAIESVEILRLALKESVAEHLLGRVVIFLIIQPVNAPKIRYTALR